MIARVKFEIAPLVNEMLDRLPEAVWKSKTTTFIDPWAGGGQFIVEIVKRLRQAGHSDANIRRRVFGVFDSMLALNYAKRWHGLIATLVTHLEEAPDMTFDTVVMNPPYQKDLHIKLMQRALRLSARYVLSIQPAGWVTSQKPRLLGVRQSTARLETIREIGDHVVSLDLINMMDAFNGAVQLYDTGGIFLIDKAYHGPVAVTNLSGQTYLCSDIAHVNEHGNNPLYVSIEEKILGAVQTHGSVLSRRNAAAPYLVEIARIRGHVQTAGGAARDFRKDDYFTWVPNDRQVSQKVFDRGRHNMTFDTPEEAAIFLAFLRTKIARFALKLVKSNSTVDQHHLKLLPNLNWTCEWTSERLQSVFGLTDDEMAYIDASLPNY